MGINITGTGVALVTPFKKDFTLDLDAFRKLLDHVKSNKVDYVVVNGTTAESATTTLEEKNQLLEVTKNHLKGTLPIVFGIGGNNTAEVLDRISKTDLNGVTAILSVCPYYNKPSQEGIYQHYKLIAEKSPAPVIIYNVPGRTGVNIKAKTTARLACTPNIIAIKEASGDVVQVLDVLKRVPEDFIVISGDDLLTVPLISIGAKGVISVLANAYPEEFCSMVKKSLAGDFAGATKTLKKFVELNPLLYEESNPVGIKQVMEHLQLCQAHVRLPLVKASEELKMRLQEKIKDI
ncbi:MAG: 4-hydroxy-tetrahydrodipicolinate synthase [Cytophagaceae bacterium]